MRTLLVLTVLCSSAVIAQDKSRESRNLDWLFGGFSLFGAPSSELAENIKTNDQRIKLQNKSFQRRTSKIEPDESRGLPRGRVLNRPPPTRVGGPVKGYQPPKRPPPSFQRKPNVAAPIIISSYASTSIQGRGQDDEERIRERIDKISQYEAQNDISTDDVEQKEEEVKVDGRAETGPDPVTETEEIATTTLRPEEDPTTTRETTSKEVGDFDIIEESASPYLPVIPEALDDDIHGVHLAGYQEVPEVKANTGVDRTEQALLKKKINNPASVFPLGKPKPKPQAPGAAGPAGRPSFKPSNKQRERLPVKPAASNDGSIFDLSFLPFWGSSKEQQEKKPRRPIGPPPPPPSRPMQELPREELPVRSEVAVQPSISSRIDSSSSVTVEEEEEEEKNVQAYIVLPAQELKPKQEKPTRLKIGPQRPTQPFNGPRLPPPRLRVPPPPRPLLGLPRAPATRKQAPFIGKRPLLPPKVPTGFAGAPLKTPFLKTNSAPQDTSRTSLKKPLEKLFKKGESLSPKVIAKLTSQTAVQGKKPFDFRPNGSTEKQSQISSHLSSFMNFLFQTTPSPAPAPSLPSLVEDTEFADIVNGYKPSDKNISESVDGGKENEISTTTPAPPSKILTTLKPQEKDDIYDELDSLTAPVPDKTQNIQKIIKSKKRPPPPPPPAHFSQKRPAFRPKLKLPLVKIPPTTTTTTAPTLPPVQSTTVATTRRTSTSSTSSTTTRPSRQREKTTLPGPIQALVSEYQQKGHVVSQETYPKPVLMAIKKNFEHKKNIFSQFVTFSENDKAFIPNKEVVSSDWAVDSLHSLPTSDKILVYQTLPPSPSTPPPPPPPAPPVSPDQTQRRTSGGTFPNERNAEGGFKPMLRPLHSPLLNK